MSEESLKQLMDAIDRDKPDVLIMVPKEGNGKPFVFYDTESETASEALSRAAWMAMHTSEAIAYAEEQCGESGE